MALLKLFPVCHVAAGCIALGDSPVFRIAIGFFSFGVVIGETIAKHCRNLRNREIVVIHGFLQKNIECAHLFIKAALSFHEHRPLAA